MILTLSGTADICADRVAVWDALHDASCLKLCIPGCQTIERASPSRFELTVRVGLGILSLPVSGAVDIHDCDRPRMLCLKATGAGGLTGLVSGQIKMTLLDTRRGCRIDYVGEIEPRGAFATLGRAILAHRASKMIERFISAFAANVGGLPLDQRMPPVSPRGPIAPKA